MMFTVSPLSSPTNLFCIDTSRFSVYFLHKSRSPRTVGYVLFLTTLYFTDSYLYSYSALCPTTLFCIDTLRFTFTSNRPSTVEHVVFVRATCFTYSCVYSQPVFAYQSFCPLSAPTNLFCTDTWRFSAYFLHKSRSPSTVGYVLFLMTLYFTYSYVYSHSALRLRLLLSFVLIRRDFLSTFSTNLVPQVLLCRCSLCSAYFLRKSPSPSTVVYVLLVIGCYFSLIRIFTVALLSVCAYQSLCIDTSRFSAYFLHKSHSPHTVGYVLFLTTPYFTYSYLYSHSALCAYIPVSFVLIH